MLRHNNHTPPGSTLRLDAKLNPISGFGAKLLQLQTFGCSFGAKYLQLQWAECFGEYLGPNHWQQLAATCFLYDTCFATVNRSYIDLPVIDVTHSNACLLLIPKNARLVQLGTCSSFVAMQWCPSISWTDLLLTC